MKIKEAYQTAKILAGLALVTLAGCGKSEIGHWKIYKGDIADYSVKVDKHGRDETLMGRGIYLHAKDLDNTKPRHVHGVDFQPADGVWDKIFVSDDDLRRHWNYSERVETCYADDWEELDPNSEEFRREAERLDIAARKVDNLEHRTMHRVYYDDRSTEYK